MTVWGLWKQLPPLPAGEHEIGFRGGDGYSFELAVDYRLDVTGS